MKKSIILFTAIVFLAACNSNAPKDNSESSSNSTYTVASLMASADELVDKEITVKGLVVHVCKHGGQKMFITSEDKETKIKVNVSETIAEFDIALEGSMVEINGLVVAVDTAPSAEEGEGEHHAEEAEESVNQQADKADCASEQSEECDSEETEEEDCDFEKETIVYELKALSYKEINE